MSRVVIVLWGMVFGLGLSAMAANAAEPTALLSTNRALAADPLAAAVEKEFQQILAQDDSAQAEADRWIREDQAFKAKGVSVGEATLTLRIQQRFDSVRRAYEDFLLRRPDHVRARLAFGSFLSDLGKDNDARFQWEKARALDPKNPAAWNNLAQYYSHHGPVTNAFVHFAKASELNPREPIYYQNLASVILQFRPQAQLFYQLDSPQVCERALGLYRQALKLAPDRFVLASELAQTYYALKPFRAGEARDAWLYALKLAGDDLERQGVQLHLARVALEGGRTTEVRPYLATVNDPQYATLKKELEQRLAAMEKGAPPGPQ